jgi:hypothetical protein
MKTRLGFAVVSLAALGVSAAWAGTYNFYFNNTEQGAGSTAAPTVTVSDEAKPAKAPAEAPSAPAAVPASAPAEAPALGPPGAIPPPPPGLAPPEILPPPGESVAAAPVEPARPARVRLDFGLSGLFQGGDYSSQPLFAPTIGVAFFPIPELGLHFFGGAYLNSGQGNDSYTSTYGGGYPYGGNYGYGSYSSTPEFFFGAELELLPIRISIGRFENLLEIGLLGGGSTIAASYDNVFTFHGGGIVNVNLGEHWGLTGAVRGNLGYVMGSAGLIVHL